MLMGTVLGHCAARMRRFTLAMLHRKLGYPSAGAPG